MSRPLTCAACGRLLRLLASATQGYLCPDCRRAAEMREREAAEAEQKREVES